MSRRRAIAAMATARGTRGRPHSFCLLSLALLAAATGPAFGAGVRDRLRDASNNRHWNKHDVALKLCEGIVSDKEAKDTEKIDAFDIMIDVFRRQRKGSEALLAAERMRRSFPGDKEAEGRALFAEFYCYRDVIRSYPLALTKLRRLVKLGADEKTLARAHAEMANVLLRQRRYAEAYHEAQKAVSTEVDDEWRIASTLWQMQEAAWKNGDFAACASAVERLLDPKYLRRRNTREHAGFYLRYAACIERSGEYTRQEARGYLRRIEKETQEGNPKVSQELALKIARSLFDDGLYDEAIRAYERVFVDHAGISEHWYDAQRAIVEAYVIKGSPEEALRAARICLDHGKHGVSRNLRLVAELLREVDGGDVKRANSLFDYQRWGPAGEDGKVGTADDLKDPLRSVGYPSYPERERAFLRDSGGARSNVGDGAWASRHRALTYTYTGHPGKALACYLDAFRRSSDGDFQRMAEDSGLIGLRAVRGHAAGLEPAFRLVAFGPAGPDGRPGTEDDIFDPFAGLLAATGINPVAGHSEEDVAALRRVRDFLVEVARDRTNSGGERQDALWALQRVNEALADWKRPPLGWYIDIAIEEGDDRTQEAIVGVAQAAAKAGGYHLGGVHAFWRELDSRLKEKGKGLGGRARNRRRNFQRAVDRLAKKQRIAPRERHLKPDQERRGKFREPGREPPPEPRRPDPTPPKVPSGLAAKSVSYRWAQITWQPAEDPESGIALYEVFRNGRLVATTKETSFTDRTLEEDTKYAYRIVAVSEIGMESVEGRRVAVNTPVDREEPKVERVESAGDPERVVLVFTEEVEKAGAEDPSNYHVSQGVRVRSAALSPAQKGKEGEGAKSVTLTLSKLSPELTYTLRMRNITDRAKTPNTVDPAREFAFEFVDTGDGLRGVYYDEIDFKGKTLERVDREIRFNWSRKNPAPGIANTNFSVRWRGKVRPDHSETYTFYARTDDGVRLWIDGKRVINDWNHRGATDSRAGVKLRAGMMYDIKMEYFQGGGEASCELHWSSKSVKREIIPQANLYSR